MFNPDDFLASLSSSGPQLTTGIKGDWVGLYKRFFRSPNFSGWFHARYTELTQQLQVKQLEKLSQAVRSRFLSPVKFSHGKLERFEYEILIDPYMWQDLKTWVQGKQEVEVVDMILRIRQKLEKSCIDDIPIDNSVREKLRERMNDITHVLPDDLKVILRHESWQYDYVINIKTR